MFNAYEFTFAGESSYMYDLMIYNFDIIINENFNFGNEASIVETRINNRVQPIHFGVNYHTNPLEFKIVFGSLHELDRYDLERIAMWLTGHQDYQWLSIDQPDLRGVQFRCLVTSLTPITHGWLPYAFEAQITCDCPYAYGLPFEKEYSVYGKTSIVFHNSSSVREYIRPTLQLVPSSGVKQITIINESDNNREFSFKNLPSSSVNIVVDNLNCIITDTMYGYNLYDTFNMNFFRLVPGDNKLVVTGNCLMTISGRFLHNVGG